MECEFNEENEIKELDKKWMIEFENSDQLYQNYYADDNCYTNIHYIYINKNNDIEKIKQEFFYMSKPNFILKEEMIGLLKRNSIDNNTRYTLLSILKININIQPSDIKKILQTDDLDYYKDKFCTLIKNIDTIAFEKTINMFQDLNDVCFIFYENNVNITNKINTKNITKKIYLNVNKTARKTLKKQYKEIDVY
jgi:hypothetical protein